MYDNSSPVPVFSNMPAYAAIQPKNSKLKKILIIAGVAMGTILLGLGVYFLAIPLIFGLPKDVAIEKLEVMAEKVEILEVLLERIYLNEEIISYVEVLEIDDIIRNKEEVDLICSEICGKTINYTDQEKQEKFKATTSRVKRKLMEYSKDIEIFKSFDKIFLQKIRRINNLMSWNNNNILTLEELEDWDVEKESRKLRNSHNEKERNAAIELYEYTSKKIAYGRDFFKDCKSSKNEACRQKWRDAFISNRSYRQRNFLQKIMTSRYRQNEEYEKYFLMDYLGKEVREIKQLLRADIT